MVTTKPEILEAAKRIIDFFRRIYPKTNYSEGERNLATRIEQLSNWVIIKPINRTEFWNLGGGHTFPMVINEKRIEAGGGNLYEERWRAKRLKQLYERGDEEEIFSYGKENINSMTGGWFGDSVPDVGFHNETTQNHLRIFRADYSGNPFGDYAQEPKLTPFYLNLVKEAEDIGETASKIRREICANEDFIKKVDIAVREAKKRTCISSEREAPRSGLYLLKEFKKKDEVIPLIKRVEQLYTGQINLTKAVIQEYEDIA